MNKGKNKNLFPNNYAQERTVFTHGKGVWLYDNEEKKYLDFGAGIAVNALGYGRDDFADIVSAQMKKIIHISNLYNSEPAIELAGKMVNSGPFSAVQFGNSGTEANEAAIKYSRLFSLRKKGKNNHKILCFKNAFHGRTIGSLSCTPTKKYQEPFEPLMPGVEVCTFNDSNEVSSILDSSFAAVIMEVIQGEGGINEITKEFAGTLNELCSRFNIILIADEIQTGLSRTGAFYAYSEAGLKPDIVTLSKPLAGGLPLSATLIPEKINFLVHPGEHATTFGGGPVTTALASKIWDILSDKEFISNVHEKGNYLQSILKNMKNKYSFIGKLKGRGLLQGIEINGPDIPGILEQAQNLGLLILRSGVNIIRMAPPLIITKEEIDTSMNILQSIFDKL